MAYSNLSTLDLFGDLQTSKDMISGKMVFKIWSRMSMTIILSYVVRVLVQVKTKTCLMPRRSFLCGIGDGELACIVFRKWWSPNKSRNQMGPDISWLQLYLLSLQLLKIVQCLFLSLSYWVDPWSDHLEYQKSKLFLRSNGYLLATSMK